MPSSVQPSAGLRAQRARPPAVGLGQPRSPARATSRAGVPAAPFVEAGLALFLVVCVVKIAERAFLPLPAAEISGGAPASGDAAPAEAAILNPFSVVLDGPAPSSAFRMEESDLDLSLHGTWQGPEGTMAAIAVGAGKQTLFSVGDVLAEGVRLKEVRDDYVVISQFGTDRMISMVNRLTPSSRDELAASVVDMFVLERIDAAPEVSVADAASSAERKSDADAPQ